jgi:magnesium-transporting ATPase (P-type)
MAASMNQQLETKLNSIFSKNAPQLPSNSKKTLVEWAPWAALIVGLLSLWAAYALWGWAHIATGLINYANSLCTAYGGYSCNTAATDSMTFWVWISLAALTVEGGLYLLAFPGLRDHKKAGWNFLYWGALVNVVYAVISLLTNYGFGNFVVSLIGSVIGLWLLFQVHDMYLGERVAHSHPKK